MRQPVLAVTLFLVVRFASAQTFGSITRGDRPSERSGIRNRC
jgi:hypothetical protein